VLHIKTESNLLWIHPSYPNSGKIPHGTNRQGDVESNFVSQLVRVLKRRQPLSPSRAIVVICT
jgi:hypothetical protein